MDKVKLTPETEAAMTMVSGAIGKAMRAEGLSQAQMDRITERAMPLIGEGIDDGYVHLATFEIHD